MSGFFRFFNSEPKKTPVEPSRNTSIPFILVNQTQHFATIKLNQDFIFQGKPVRLLNPEDEALWYEYLYVKHHLMLVAGGVQERFAICQKLCETIVCASESEEAPQLSQPA
jgi:hypothetical protein